MKRLESRLTKLEVARRDADTYADDPNRPKHLSELLGGPYDPTITLPRIFAAMEKRMAEEIAAGTYKPPPAPDPDYWPPNVIDVESELLKIQGDRDGWKARQLFLKRDVMAIASETIDRLKLAGHVTEMLAAYIYHFFDALNDAAPRCLAAADAIWGNFNAYRMASESVPLVMHLLPDGPVSDYTIPSLWPYAVDSITAHNGHELVTNVAFELAAGIGMALKIGFLKHDWLEQIERGLPTLREVFATDRRRRWELVPQAVARESRQVLRELEDAPLPTRPARPQRPVAERAAGVLWYARSLYQGERDWCHLPNGVGVLSTAAMEPMVRRLWGMMRHLESPGMPAEPIELRDTVRLRRGVDEAVAWLSQIVDAANTAPLDQAPPATGGNEQGEEADGKPVGKKRRKSGRPRTAKTEAEKKREKKIMEAYLACGKSTNETARQFNTTAKDVERIVKRVKQRQRDSAKRNAE